MLQCDHSMPMIKLRDWMPKESNLCSKILLQIFECNKIVIWTKWDFEINTLCRNKFLYQNSALNQNRSMVDNQDVTAKKKTNHNQHNTMHDQHNSSQLAPSPLKKETSIVHIDNKNNNFTFRSIDWIERSCSKEETKRGMSYVLSQVRHPKDIRIDQDRLVTGRVGRAHSNGKGYNVVITIFLDQTGCRATCGCRYGLVFMFVTLVNQLITNNKHNNLK